MKKNERLISEVISDFIKLMDKSNSLYQTAYEMVNIEDKKTSDILHKFELEALTPSEKSKLCTLLKNSRKDRRYWKDITQTLLPMVNLLKDNTIKTTLHRTKQMLGEVRKSEENLKDRYYIYRVLGGDE